MSAIIPFTEWVSRFSNEEYSLLRHRMRGIQFAGPNIMRRWDMATALNWVDLEEQMLPQFKALLIKEGIVSAARAEDYLLARRH